MDDMVRVEDDSPAVSPSGRVTGFERLDLPSLCKFGRWVSKGRIRRG